MKNYRDDFMYKSTQLSVIALFVMAQLFLTACSNNEEPAVLQSFEGYKTAILNNDGAKAYDFIDKNTRDYYALTLDRALHLSASDTKSLNIIDMMNVLLARHAIDKDELKSMDGRDFFIYATDKGWIDKERTADVNIKVASIEDNIATTHLVRAGQEAPFGFLFTKEEGQWKIDLSSVFDVSRKVMETTIDAAGMMRTEFIFTVLETSTGHEADASLWQPVI